MKKFLIIILLLSLAGCSSHLGADLQFKEPTLKEWEKVDSPLKLKANKEKILKVDTVNECVEYSDEFKIECKKSEEVKKYHYISDKKVDKQTYTYKDKDSKKETVLQEDLSKRTKNSLHFKLPKDEKLLGSTETGDTYIAKFYSGSPFYEDENGDYYQTEVATTTIEAYEEQASSTEEMLGDSGDPVYAGAGDGEVYHRNPGTSWDTVHDASTGLSASYTSTWNRAFSHYVDVNRYDIDRAFIPFDTSGLPTGANISAASLNLFNTGTSDGGSSESGYDNYIVQTTQSSNTSLSTSDYDQCGDTDDPDTAGSFDPRDHKTVGSKNTITLNATGRGWISDSGYTKLGIRTGFDVFDDVPPSNNAQKVVYEFRTSEYTGTDYDPYLEITYTEGGASRRVMFIN